MKNLSNPTLPLDASDPPQALPTPEPSSLGPIHTDSAPNSSIRGGEIGKRQMCKDELKLAGLDRSGSSALAQSGD